MRVSIVRSGDLCNEFLIDAKLHIDTIVRDDQYSDTYRYPYEPTAYAVLERIAESGYITKNDLLIDYGSGKKGNGRTIGKRRKRMYFCGSRLFAKEDVVRFALGGCWNEQEQVRREYRYEREVRIDKRSCS